MMLRPFLRYYGAKWRATAAGRYPPPRHGTIIEPFAGAAGYSLHFPDREVVLVERYHVIAEIWRWLISVPRREVEAIPLVDSVDKLPLDIPPGARFLIGFAMNAATATPRRSVAASGLALRSRGRRLYGWTADMRARVASQVDHIRHWRVIEGDYADAPDVEATWFVDPPYQGRGGSHYVHGSRSLDYQRLGTWCRARSGQTIVCEAAGASWLPFRSIGNARSGPRSIRSAEAVWP